MLARQYRLPRSVAFHNARVLVTPYFKVLVRENNLSHNRFGFVVSKKIDKRAVMRNRLRRILATAVSQNLLSDSKDMLLMVKQSFVKEKTQEITSLVQSTMEKL